MRDKGEISVTLEIILSEPNNQPTAFSFLPIQYTFTLA